MLDLRRCRAIGMVQPAPLPGSYRHKDTPFAAILGAVLEEAGVLAECSFDAVILQNMGDMPIRQHSRPEAIAYMAVIAQAIKQAFPKMMLGVLINWDGVASLSVAEAAGADFVRVEHVYNGAEVTSAGLIQAQCCEILDLKKRTGSDIPITADIYEPHGVPLGRLSIEDAAWQAVHETFADGLFLSGHDATESIELAKRARTRVPGVPVFLGGGATGDNVAQLAQYFDGICVATWIKNGNMGNPIDRDRAKLFVERIRTAKLGGI
jgi:membrane complex biogenesis BtpA family protein